MLVGAAVGAVVIGGGIVIYNNREAVGDAIEKSMEMRGEALRNCHALNYLILSAEIFPQRLYLAAPGFLLPRINNHLPVFVSFLQYLSGSPSHQL